MGRRIFSVFDDSCEVHSICRIKVKVTLDTCQKGSEGEQRYSSTLSLTSVLDGCGWSMPRSDHFTPGEDPILIVQKAGWSGPVWKILPLPGFNPKSIHPVASHCTDYTILSHHIRCISVHGPVPDLEGYATLHVKWQYLLYIKTGLVTFGPQRKYLLPLVNGIVSVIQFKKHYIYRI